MKRTFPRNMSGCSFVNAVNLLEWNSSFEASDRCKWYLCWIWNFLVGWLRVNECDLDQSVMMTRCGFQYGWKSYDWKFTLTGQYEERVYCRGELFPFCSSCSCLRRARSTRANVGESKMDGVAVDEGPRRW